MPRATKTASATKRQKAIQPEAQRLRYEHQKTVWFLTLATLVVVVGLTFMAVHVPGGPGLIGTAFGAIAGKELINSGPRIKHP